MLKLVQAVIRRELLEEVVAALKRSGVPRLTISYVQAVGSGADPEDLKLSLELGSGYSDKALLQFVCPEEETDALVTVIREHAHTGCRGDGAVFISPVERAVKIRTGAEGVEAVA